MADRRIGSDHTPMRKKSRPITAHLHATPLENGGHCLPSERTTEGFHISRRAGIPPTPAPPQTPSAHVSLGQGLPQIVREARLVDCQEQIFAARRHMRPAGLYVKREKPGFDWAFLRASTRQHSSPAPIGNQREA